MRKLQRGGVKSFLKNIFLKPEQSLPPRMQAVLTLEDRQAYMDSLEPIAQVSTPQIDLRPSSNIVAPSPIPISTSPKIQTNYSGNSIVDFLRSANINDTSLQSRRELGKSLGINNIGTAEGNLALLAKLRGENYIAPTKTAQTEQRTIVKPATQRQIQKISPQKDLNPYRFDGVRGDQKYAGTKEDSTIKNNTSTSINWAGQTFNSAQDLANYYLDKRKQNVPTTLTTQNQPISYKLNNVLNSIKDNTYVPKNTLVKDPSKVLKREDILKTIASDKANYERLNNEYINYINKKDNRNEYYRIMAKSSPSRTNEERKIVNDYRKYRESNMPIIIKKQEEYKQKLNELQKKVRQNTNILYSLDRK